MAAACSCACAAAPATPPTVTPLALAFFLRPCSSQQALGARGARQFLCPRQTLPTNLLTNQHSVTHHSKQL